MKLKLSDVFNVIRIVILIGIIAVMLWLPLHLLNELKDFINIDRDYETIVKYEPQERAKPDTVIRWFERIMQEEVEPIIRYDTVLYALPEDIPLINFIKSNSRRLIVRTQRDTLTSIEYVYPYTDRFQIIPQREGLSFISYRDWLTWNKLFISLSSDFQHVSEMKLHSQFRINPFKLSIQPYVKYRNEFEYGIEIEKQLF